MAKKRIDPKAKQKRQKIMVIVGSVLLLGILGIQVPKTMKMMNPAPVAAPVEASVSTSDTPVAGTAAAAEVTLVDAPILPSADVAADYGQLVSFHLFETKDPFVQQADTQGTGSDEGDSGTDAPPAVDAPLPPDVAPLPPDVAPPDVAPPGGDTGSDGSGTGSGTGGSDSGSGSSSGGSTATHTGATISVNGVEELVTVGKDFPNDDPLFTLVSVGETTVEIAIAGGSYQDGASTVTLSKGKTLTLMNTTDGARYEIRLVSVGVPESSSTTP